jgi:protein SCO1/2
MAYPSRGTRSASRIRRAGAVALAAATVLSAPALAQPPAGEKPREIRGMELQNNLGKKLPLDVKLVDSNGKEVKLGDKFGHGRPVVVSMIYLRCPLLCPQLQQKVIHSFNKIPDFTVGTDYDVLFISFDFRDTAIDAAKAKELALSTYDRTTTENVRQGFSYLVGEADDTQKVADALGFPYRFLRESGEFAHGTAVYVVSPNGVISNCFPKLDYEPKDLRLSLVQASNGKIGTLLDTFTLWCYHSTLTGKYQIAALKVMRIGAALTAVLVFGFVGFWAVRDRRRRRRLLGDGGTGAGSNSFSAPDGALGHSR